MRTCAPCEASSSAVARPIPRAEPVTIADLPSSTPIAFRSPCRVYVRGDYPRGNGPAEMLLRHGDDTEVLGVDGPPLAVGERAWGVGRDAYGGVPEVAVEDVRTVT